MFQKYPDARRIINRLTDETQYEFTLNGRLEFVEGTDASVVWEKVNITKRDVLVNEDTTKSTHPYVAKSGLLDKPAKVQYPEVQISIKEPVV
ncbi:aerolysin, partial [Biomphalaria pfeifferi]